MDGQRKFGLCMSVEKTAQSQVSFSPFGFSLSPTN
jgi:hypothetical protein